MSTPRRQLLCLYVCPFVCDMCEWWYRVVKRLIGCLKLQVIFRKRATNYRSLLRKMTCNSRHPMTLRHPVHAHLFVICVCGDTSMCVCVYAQYVCLSPWRIDVYGQHFRVYKCMRFRLLLQVMCTWTDHIPYFLHNAFRFLQSLPYFTTCNYSNKTTTTHAYIHVQKSKKTHSTADGGVLRIEWGSNGVPWPSCLEC